MAPPVGPRYADALTVFMKLAPRCGARLAPLCQNGVRGVVVDELEDRPGTRTRADEAFQTGSVGTADRGNDPAGPGGLVRRVPGRMGPPDGRTGGCRHPESAQPRQTPEL